MASINVLLSLTDRFTSPLSSVANKYYATSSKADRFC